MPTSASGGVALIRPFACNGRALTQGSGFLVGTSVVENPTYPLPSQWRIRWAFPNGQACDTPFTVA